MGRGFASPEDISRLQFIPAHEHNRKIPHFVSWALAKAVNKNPRERYCHLSEFLTDLEKPNPASLESSFEPMARRNPVAFWRAVALILLIINLVQAIW
jgi:ribosomal protein L39E